MNLRSARLLLLTPALAVFLSAAEEAASKPEPEPSVKESLKSLVLEDAKKKAAQPAPAQAPSPAQPAAKPAATTPSPVGQPKEVPPPKPPAAADPAATNLPKVEIRSRKITELDLQIKAQEKEMAREAKNAKATELDQTLNNDKVSKILSIFGGKSATQRETLAEERLAIMEAEKDLMEEIARAKTKEDKELLEQQLRDLRALRRDLEKASN